jgi:hypothetical protein
MNNYEDYAVSGQVPESKNIKQPVKERRIMGAKNISKWGMVLSAISIISYNIIYVIFEKKIPTLEEQKSILLFGGSMLVIFSPVYLSIVLDKVGEIFKGGK